MKRLFAVFLILYGPLFATEKAYVVNTTAGTVSVIDVDTATKDEDITVGTSPIDIAISSDSAYAYVTNSGSASISVIRLDNNTVTETISLAAGTEPYGIVVDSTGTYAYVTDNRSSGSLGVVQVNLASGTVNNTQALAARPTFLSITPNDTRIYVTTTGFNVSPLTIPDLTLESVIAFDIPRDLVINNASDHVYIIFDQQMEFEPGTIYAYPIPGTSSDGSVTFADSAFLPQRIIINADDDTLWVSCSPSAAADFIIPVTISYSAPTTTLTFGTAVNLDASVEAARGLALTADESKIYVCGATSGTVSPVPLPSGPAGTPISTGAGAFSVAITTPASPSSGGGTVSGVCKRTTFFTQEEYYIELSWTDTGTTPETYQIYRDAANTDLVGSVAGTAEKKFTDQNRFPENSYTYYVVAVASDSSTTSIGSTTVSCP